MDVHRTDAPAETHEPLGRVIIVLAIAFLGVAAIAASVDQAYCTDPEARFGGLGWLIVMAPVVFLGALIAAAFVTAITPDALGMAAWVAVLAVVPVAAGVGYAVGLARLGCELRSLDSVIELAVFASVPAAGIGGVIGWVTGSRRGR